MPRICFRVVFVWLSFDYFSDFARFTLLRFIRLLCGCEGFSLYRSIIGTFALIGCPYAGLARASQALCRAVAALVGHPLAISLLAACSCLRASAVAAGGRSGLRARPGIHCPQGCQALAMILTQVHLRKPCYDFYFLEVIKFVSLSAGDVARERRVPPAVREPH